MNTTKQLYQWDINQMLVDCTGLYVDFPVNGEIYRVETKDGECLIPDEFIQAGGRQKIWECMPDCTRKEFVLEIKARPMPPDYAFTPTEKLTFDGLVKRVDDAVADMIRMADSGEFDGYTPVKGKDYFTADEIKQIQDEVSSGAVGDFKSVVDAETETFKKSAEAWTHGHPEYPERDEDNAAYYAGVASENAGSAYDSLVETKRLASQVHSDADATSQNTSLAEQYKAQAAQSAANALFSEQAAKVSETAAQEAQAGAETAEGQAELYAGQTASDKISVELIKSETDKTAQKIVEDKNTVQRLADDFTLTHQQAVADVNNAGQAQTERVENAGEAAVDEIEVARQQAINSVSDEGESQKNVVKSEGDTQVANVQAVVDGIAQESTAQQILEKSNQSLPFLEEIARNSGKAGSLNGFGLEKGVNDSVVITYTNPETEQFESASVLPTDTTLVKIDEAIAGINESLKIIALQKGVEA